MRSFLPAAVNTAMYASLAAMAAVVAIFGLFDLARARNRRGLALVIMVSANLGNLAFVGMQAAHLAEGEFGLASAIFYMLLILCIGGVALPATIWSMLQPLVRSLVLCTSSGSMH